MAEKNKNLNINNDLSWPNSEEEGELAVDLYETNDALVLQTIIGGVKAKDLDIAINNDMITIKGERNREKDEIIKFYYDECFWGKFSRSLVLPFEVDTDKAEAVLKNGLLTITLPKMEKVRKKTLTIEEED
ncbi:MAG: Hsp20/alpha crystallin family protein [Minisyncoccia bacterium]|jgi:HSP20 family protein